MGYTRYWKRTDKELTVDFIEAVKEIIADCESKGIHICDGYGKGDPEVRLDKVWINGNGLKDLDHETIYFDNKPSNFEFCKTARKPYDYALRRILKVAETEGLVTDVRSDGENDEIINDEGKVIGSTRKERKQTVNEVNTEDVLDLALSYKVDQFDILESFLCDLLNVSPDRLYELIDEKSNSILTNLVLERK